MSQVVNPYYRYSPLHSAYIVFDSDNKVNCSCKTIDEAQSVIEKLTDEDDTSVIGFGDHIPPFILKQHGYKYQNV